MQHLRPTHLPGCRRRQPTERHPQTERALPRVELRGFEPMTPLPASHQHKQRTRRKSYAVQLHSTPLNAVQRAPLLHICSRRSPVKTASRFKVNENRPPWRYRRRSASVVPACAGLVRSPHRHVPRLARRPRMRGAGPLLSRPVAHHRTSSPHARGWSLAIALNLYAEQVVPARAQLVLAARVRLARWCCRPRALGWSYVFDLRSDDVAVVPPRGVVTCPLQVQRARPHCRQATGTADSPVRHRLPGAVPDPISRLEQGVLQICSRSASVSTPTVH